MEKPSSVQEDKVPITITWGTQCTKSCQSKSEKTGMLLLLSKDLMTAFFWQKMFFVCKFSFKPRLNSGWSGWEVEGSHGLSGQGDVHEERFLFALAYQVLASWNWRKVGKKKILLRFLFLVVGSGFLAHWKNLAFTQNQDDKLVSIIGGEAYMNNWIFLLSELNVDWT